LSPMVAGIVTNSVNLQGGLRGAPAGDVRGMMSEQKAKVINCRRAELCRVVQGPRRIGTCGGGAGRLVV